MDRILTQEIKQGCGVFDGVAGNSISINNTGYTSPMTVEGWLKFGASAMSTGTNIIPLGNFVYPHSSNDFLYFTGTNAYVNYKPVVNQWFHLAVTWNGNITTAKAYINGVEVAIVLQGSTSAVPIPNNIGGPSWGAFKGSIDEVRIWNYARTAQQIKDNFNRVLKPQTGLIAYYKLDGNALDSSGNGNHGTVNGGVSWSVDGRVNDVSQVAEFMPASNTTISTTLNHLSQTRTTYSMEAFVWLNGTTGAHQVPLGHNNNGNYISATNNNILAPFCSFVIDGTQRTVYASRTLPLNTWHHIVSTYNGTTIRLYVNGVEVNSLNIAGSLSITGNPIRIGSFDPTACIVNGKISYCRVWDKALTQQEIQANMFKILPANTTGLIEQWTLNGHALGTKGNNGTLVGGTKFTPDVPTVKADVSTTLEKSKAIVSSNIMDGAVITNKNGFLNTKIPNNTSYNLTGSFTIGVWVNPYDMSGASGLNTLFNIIDQQQNTNGYLWCYFTGSSKADNISFQYNLSDGSSRKTFVLNDVNGVVPLSKPSHIAYVYNASNLTLKLYINAVERASVTLATTLAPINIADRFLYYGNYNGGSFILNGELQHMRIYQAALSVEQIASSYKVPNVAGSSNLLLAHNMRELGIATNTTAAIANHNKLLVSRDKQPYMVRFSGTEYIDCGNSTVLQNLTKITVSIVVKFPDTTRSQTLVSKSSDNGGFSIYTSSGKIRGIIRTSGGGYGTLSPSDTFVANKWYVIILRIGATATLFIDGLIAANNNSPSYIPENIAPLSIGAANHGGVLSSYTNTDITECKVWNRDLTDNEIADVTAGKTITNGLILHKGYNYTLYDTTNNNLLKYVVTPQLLPSTAPVGQRSGLKFPVSSAALASTPHNSNFSIVNQVTMEAWVNMYDFWSNGTVVVKQDAYYLQIHSDRKVQMFLYGVTPTGYKGSTTTIPQNTWTHVATTYDGSNVRLYINGLLSGTFAATGSITTTTTPVNIGAETASARPLRGVVSNVRVWNTALQQAEIQKNMHRYLPADTPNLIEQWKLNEGVGTTVYGTKGNNGIITGTTTWTTPSLMNYVGKQARFVGINDTTLGNQSMKIDCGTGASLDLGETGTIECWVKSNNPYPRTNTNINSNNAFRAILKKVTATNNESYYLDWYGTTTSRTLRGGINGQAIVATVDLSTAKHLAFSWSHTTMWLYVDGVQVATGARTAPMLRQPTVPLLIGGQVQSSTNYEYGWDGIIDEVRLWNVARTATQIQENMNKTLGREAGLVLNMGFESDYYDASGYGNHGTPVGNPVIEVTDNDKLLLNAPIN
jgi:hypothetical protein